MKLPVLSRTAVHVLLICLYVVLV